VMSDRPCRALLVSIDRSKGSGRGAEV
jgi:hypothetical protein